MPSLSYALTLTIHGVSAASRDLFSTHTVSLYTESLDLPAKGACVCCMSGIQCHELAECAALSVWSYLLGETLLLGEIL